MFGDIFGGHEWNGGSGHVETRNPANILQHAGRTVNNLPVINLDSVEVEKP